MSVGSKIKEKRIKMNLTQKDLADKLNVTYQAVSRWEKDEVEPSFDTLAKLSSIFNCSIDELFGIERAQNIQEVKPTERIVYRQTDPVLTICEKCNRPIYRASDIHRFETKYRTGRTDHKLQHIYCTECNDKRNEDIRQKEKITKINNAAKVKKNRIQSFIWPSLFAALFIALGIYFFAEKGERSTIAGASSIVFGVLIFTFLSCLLLRNNFIGDMWLEIASWGFVTMPGVIFEFSLDGCFAGILIKIALWVLSGLLALASIVLATVIGIVLSVFVYPFALIKSYKYSNPENQNVTVEGVL